MAVPFTIRADNPARRLYERFGFEQVGRHGGSIIMLRSI